MYHFKYIVFGIILNSAIIFAQFSTKGMLTIWAITGNDVPKYWSKYQSTINYIPTLSLKKEISDQGLLDFEWGYQLQRAYSGDSLYNTIKKPYRLWSRYSNENLEARLGLQKIIFGPTQILRPLSWFDTFDVKDPAGETNGVEAFRLKWFPSNNISIWSWFIRNEIDTISYGGRTEVSSSIGEFGFTLHLDPSSSKKMIGQIGVPVNNSHARTAIDYRYDGFIGFWNESVLIKSKKGEILLSSIGADYTFPFANGILIMAEAMSISTKNETQNYSAIMASFPIGIMHSSTYISQFDWLEEKTYHYFRWSSTFDSYSLNMILSLNPKRNQYNIPENTLPKSILGFGTGIQFMFIYNH